MITQSLHFEVSGQDAHRLLAVCQARKIAPAQAFELFLNEWTADYVDESESIRQQKLARAGGLARFANSDLMHLEEQAVEMAIKAKYAID